MPSLILESWTNAIPPLLEEAIVGCVFVANLVNQIGTLTAQFAQVSCIILSVINEQFQLSSAAGCSGGQVHGEVHDGGHG